MDDETPATVGGVILGDDGTPVGFAARYDGDALHLTVGIEWVEAVQASTGVYIGWVPYGALLAHAQGQLSVEDLRRIARAEPPAGMTRAANPWRSADGP
ncbi:MAG TPA: hypothetical protein PKD53_16745 [Chloroflexaceae bacterium]|nr:hypothetical protein [Chloroflexaceae bacterium]